MISIADVVIVEDKKAVKQEKGESQQECRSIPELLWYAAAGELCRFKERIIYNADIIGMPAVRPTGKGKVPGLTFVYYERFRFIFLRLICPGSIIDIVGRVAEDQISLTGMNFAEVFSWLQMEVRTAAEWEQ